MKRTRKCRVGGCDKHADWGTYVYDLVSGWGTFLEPYKGFGARYLCDEHRIENERQARGVQVPRSFNEYPHTPLNTSGVIRYKSLRTGAFIDAA
jgi:hypothetical protein